MKLSRKPSERSPFITGTGLVLFWWSLWGFLDRHLLPDIPDLRYYVGGFLGLGLIYIGSLNFHSLK